MRSGAIEKAGQQMRNADPDTARQHERTPAPPVHDRHGDEREEKVDRAGNHDIQHDLVRTQPGRAVHLFRIVEQDVDAAPLLQYRKHNADEQNLARASTQGPAPFGGLCLLGAQTTCDRLDFSLRIGRAAADPLQHLRRLVDASAYEEPSRAFRNCE